MGAAYQCPGDEHTPGRQLTEGKQEHTPVWIPKCEVKGGMCVCMHNHLISVIHAEREADLTTLPAVKADIPHRAQDMCGASGQPQAPLKAHSMSHSPGTQGLGD